MILSYDQTIQPPRYNWSLKPFSLQIGPESITLLEGENGSGKSNFLKILSGILNPDLSVNSFHTEEQQLRVSGFYQPIPFDPQLNLKKNMKLWGQTPFPEDWEVDVNRYISALELEPYLNTRWGASSSGTRQKFGVAMALAQKADLYFLDEPLAHVDQKSANTIAELIKEKLEKGAAFLVTTHLSKNWPLNFDHCYSIFDGTINQKPNA